MMDHVHQFTERGCTVVPGLFTSAELVAMREAFDSLVAKVRERPEDFDARYTAREETRTDTWGVNYIFTPELYDPAFAIPFENTGLMTCARAILGERLRFGNAHALWSPQLTDYNLCWHRDSADYRPDHVSGARTHIQFNICLDEDSCLRFIPGSHQRPLTEAELVQARTQGSADLPNAETAQCRPGDVLLMNADILHRGSCSVGTPRRTLHMSVQPYDEPTGGHGSWRYMRSEGFLEMMSPAVQELMRALIAWEDQHPLSMRESLARVRRSRSIKQYVASAAPRPHAVDTPPSSKFDK